jgi:aldehyde:ferredoxin oxidoreductase
MLFGAIVSEYVTNPMLEAETWAEFYSATTGIQSSQSDIIAVGERITNLMRAFNVREGISRKDDTLPERVLKEPLPKGGIPPLDGMLNEYYKARKWNVRTGMPSTEKLKELGLEWVSEDLRLPKKDKKHSKRS